jgi:hypothetical protein
MIPSKDEYRRRYYRYWYWRSEKNREKQKARCREYYYRKKAEKLKEDQVEQALFPDYRKVQPVKSVKVKPVKEKPKKKPSKMDIFLKKMTTAKRNQRYYETHKAERQQYFKEYYQKHKNKKEE